MTATTTEVKHTPLPWRLNKHDSKTLIVADDPVVPIAGMMNTYLRVRAADADLIVHAVNSHAELLQLCKDSLDIMVNQFGFDEGADIVIDLRAAIANAES